VPKLYTVRYKLPNRKFVTVDVYAFSATQAYQNGARKVRQYYPRQTIAEIAAKGSVRDSSTVGGRYKLW